MRVIHRPVVAAAFAALAAIPLGAQKTAAPKEQPYHVTFAFNNNETYTGTMTLTVEQEKVSGKMAIDTPATVTGDVAGTLKGDAMSLDYAYNVAGDQPCTGRVTVSAKFNAARTEAKGTTHAEGCGDPLDGDFTMTKQEGAMGEGR